MRPSLLHLLTLATTTLAELSPLCLLSSTAPLPITDSDRLSTPPASHVYSVIYRSLASCPTTHYAVIVEPQTLPYTRAYIPSTRNATSVYLSEDLDGQVNVNFVLNVILMDCLHHGVLRVEELNPRRDLPELDAETVRKSVLYAVMPEVGLETTRDEYVGLRRERKDYVESVLEKYFGGENYTLIYIREREHRVEGVVDGHDDGVEIPIVDSDSV